MPQTLKIVTDPNPILHKKARDVKSVTPDILSIIDDMVKTMREKDGMGLAAVQVGLDMKIAVVEYKSTDNNDWPTPLPLTILVNPKIISLGDVCDEQEEGCLSVPDKQIKIIRPLEATILYYDTQGRRHRIGAKGMPARIMQHEIDHLNGILITDRWAIQQKEVDGK